MSTLQFPVTQIKYEFGMLLRGIGVEEESKSVMAAAVVGGRGLWNTYPLRNFYCCSIGRAERYAGGLLIQKTFLSGDFRSQWSTFTNRSLTGRRNFGWTEPTEINSLSPPRALLTMTVSHSQ